ncbi:MAG TPA: hypothetical protein VFX16_06185 [Pseudonocardiaceae bacterium]|nr:hypothetical protein [Pseudonocardiaceae bacterium]
MAAFAADDEYDREMASDGCSRFGAYLRQSCGAFRDDIEPTQNPLLFALAAWRISQPPIMTPGYVRRHPCVLEADEHWDDEGRVALTVQLAAPMPMSVVRSGCCSEWSRWERYGDAQLLEPFDNDRPAAFGILVLRVPISADALPSPRYCRTGGPTVEVAKQAVGAICHVVCQATGPALAALEGDFRLRC